MPPYPILPDHCKAVLIDVCRRWNGRSNPALKRINNNGHIVYGCRCGAAIGISPATTARALKQLQEARFPQLIDVYGWQPVTIGGKRRAREYRVTFLPTHGRPPTWSSPTSNARRIMLKDRWLDAPAYRRLSAAAKAVLTELLRRENGSNNGRIRFSGADHPTVGHANPQKTNRALRELRAEGFVVETRPTGRSGKPGVSGKTRTWRLTMIAADDEDPTLDFLDTDCEPGVDKNVSPVSLVNRTPPYVSLVNRTRHWQPTGLPAPDRPKAGSRAEIFRPFKRVRRNRKPATGASSRPIQPEVSVSRETHIEDHVRRAAKRRACAQPCRQGTSAIESALFRCVEMRQASLFRSLRPLRSSAVETPTLSSGGETAIFNRSERR